jgi:hypothetical protein
VFAPAATPAAAEAVPLPDWDAVDRALRRKMLGTRFVLWEEYRAANQRATATRATASSFGLGGVGRACRCV